LTDSADKASAGIQVPADLIQVGYITGAYGLRGGIRLTPHSPDADALLSVKTWWIDKPTLRPVQVRMAKQHSGDVTATLVDVTERDVAEALKGATVQVSRADFPALPEDEYYWTDLIGLEAVNLQGEILGKVIDMISNGPQSILRIQPPADPNAPDAKLDERLVPFVDPFVKTVDLKEKRITLDWGLDY